MSEPEDENEEGMTLRRFLKVAALVFVVLVVVGWAGLSTFFASEGFQNLVDRVLRPRLKNRGITFDQVDVDAAGQVEITNLRIRLPDGREIVLPTLSGTVNPTSLLAGEAKVTFDISELAQRYMQLRTFGVGEDEVDLRLAPESKVMYLSFASSLGNLGSREALRGDLQLRGVRMDVTPRSNPDAGFPIQFRDGTLSLFRQVLTSKGLDFTLPSMARLGGTTGEDDLVFQFDGNVRQVFDRPEFVAGKVKTQVHLEPAWARVLELLQLDEVTRKIRWFGPATVLADLEGPVFEPRVKGKVTTEDLHLRMRGDYRQIDIRFEGLRGRLHRSNLGEFAATLQGGAVKAEYHRHQDRTLKHLFANADAVTAKLTVRDRKMDLSDIRFSAYGGVAIGHLHWDLNVRKVPLRGDLTGDTAYKYSLGFRGMDLASFMQDITSLYRPIEGKLKGLIEGRGKTLMLERMFGEGRFEVEDARVGEPPRKDTLREVLGPLAAEELKGLPLGNLRGDWQMDRGVLVLPSIDVESATAKVEGDLTYDILQLDIGGSLSVRPFDAGMQGRGNLRQTLGAGGRIVARFGGRVVEPQILYTTQ